MDSVTTSVSIDTIPLRISDADATHKIILNISRMMLRRGHLSIDKYCTDDKIDDKKLGDLIGNGKYDQDIYKIKLDVGIPSVAQVADFDENILVVTIAPFGVADITNNVFFSEFMGTFAKNHKIIVFTDITDKVLSVADKKPNIEIFDKEYLMSDIMAHDSQPAHCEIVSKADLQYIINPKYAKILKNDPLARYYGAKKGDIIRIVRGSINNGIEFAYRKVVDPKPVFR